MVNFMPPWRGWSLWHFLIDAGITCTMTPIIGHWLEMPLAAQIVVGFGIFLLITGIIGFTIPALCKRRIRKLNDIIVTFRVGNYQLVNSHYGRAGEVEHMVRDLVKRLRSDCEKRGIDSTPLKRFESVWATLWHEHPQAKDAVEHSPEYLTDELLSECFYPTASRLSAQTS